MNLKDLRPPIEERSTPTSPPFGGPRMPNFLIIGAMKAGTTSLYHYLRTHPQVFMSPLKEVDFFAEEANWWRGLDWYRRQFAAAGLQADAVGEASTSYTKYPKYRGVPERIAEHIPDARLVYVIRDPIERIRSHYQHRVAVGAETHPPERALLENPIYLDYSRYAMQVERYLRCFDRRQLLIVTSENLRHDRAATVRSVYTFLGVAPDFVAPTLEHEFYRTGERASYPPALWRIRRTVRRYVPASKRAKEFVDSVLPNVFARLRRGGAPARSVSMSGFEITGDLRARLEEALRPDVARLRTYLAYGFDGWGIA